MTSITVAIPSYNKEAQIARCIDSVLKNADAIDHIIVVDNCSTDRTFEIAKSYEPRVTCIQNDQNLGMSGNFNRCIELNTSDWLMIFHADDVMLPGAIAKYRTLIKQYPDVGLIHGDSFTTIEGDESSQTYQPRNTNAYYAAGTEALTCPYGVCSAVLVRAEAYEKLGGFVINSLSSDVEMWVRISATYAVGSINTPTVIYYSNNGSTGPQSLINRTIAEIKADWDDLNERIALVYPEGSAREEYRKKVRRDAPGNYFAVVKTNIRARNWKNVFAGLKLIIVDYRGFWQLVKIVINIIMRRVLLFFGQ